MVIVLPLARTAQVYLRRFGAQPPRLPLCCPQCRGRLQHHGRYWRQAVGRRRMWRIPVYRWLCPTCGITVSLLPDLLKPYGRFLTLLREKAVWWRLAGRSLAQVAAAVSSPAVSVLSERTVSRWVTAARRWAQQRGSEPVARLLEIAPALDPYGLSPRRTDRWAELHYLRDMGRVLQAEVTRLAPPQRPLHPGVFACLNRLLGGPAYL